MLDLLAGEDLDQTSPMSWNRWERRIDEALVTMMGRELRLEPFPAGKSRRIASGDKELPYSLTSNASACFTSSALAP